jgi:hypothetical protein
VGESSPFLYYEDGGKPYGEPTANGVASGFAEVEAEGMPDRSPTAGMPLTDVVNRRKSIGKKLEALHRVSSELTSTLIWTEAFSAGCFQQPTVKITSQDY